MNTQQKAAWVQDTGIDCASQYLRFALIQSLQSRDVSTIQAAIIASQGLGLDVEIMSAKAVLRLLEEVSTIFRYYNGSLICIETTRCGQDRGISCCV